MHGGGQRNTPTSLKILKGNPGHRPINDREPKLPADAIPEPTEELDEDAAKEWRRVVGILHGSGIARTVDQAGLTAYTQLWARWLKIERAIRKDGLIVIRSKATETGYCRWSSLASSLRSSASDRRSTPRSSRG